MLKTKEHASIQDELYSILASLQNERYLKQAVSVAKKMISAGYSIDEIADITELDQQRIRFIAQGYEL